MAGGDQTQLLTVDDVRSMFPRIDVDGDDNDGGGPLDNIDGEPLGDTPICLDTTDDEPSDDEPVELGFVCRCDDCLAEGIAMQCSVLPRAFKATMRTLEVPDPKRGRGSMEADHQQQQFQANDSPQNQDNPKNFRTKKTRTGTSPRAEAERDEEDPREADDQNSQPPQAQVS